MQILFTLILTPLLIVNSFGQAPLVSNQKNMKARYDSAKAEFAAFEKEHGGFVTTKNVEMHYLAWGNKKDVPLIWIHGSFTNAYELAGMAKGITAKGYYLIAIDYYGHGLTPIPDREVSLYHVSDDIKSLMDAKKLDKAVIGGWSRGGVIATAFYDAYPENVLGLILEDGGSVSTNTHYHKMDEVQLNEWIKSIFKDRVSYARHDSEFDAYKSYYDYNGKGTQFELLEWIAKDKDGRWSIGPGIEDLFNMGTEKQFLDNILRPTKSTLFGESMSIIEPRIIYRNLNVPMLILDPVSDNDIFPYEEENLVLKNQHAKLITYKKYENAGHNIHYEKTEAFVEDLGDFLKTVKVHWKK